MKISCSRSVYRSIAVAVIIIAAAMLLPGAADVALAQGPGQGGGNLFAGEVKSVDGAVVTVTTRKGDDVEVLTDDNSVIFIPGKPGASLSDVGVGDPVCAVLRRPQEEEGRPTAILLAIVEPTEIRGHLAGGRVESLDEGAGTMTLTTRNRGEMEVGTTASTVYKVPGVEAPTFADVEVGSVVIILGEVSEDEGTARADVVAVMNLSQAERRLICGEVVGVDGAEITLEDNKGDTYVAVTVEKTVFKACDKEDVSLDDVKAGERIIVFGPSRGDKTDKILAAIVLLPGDCE